MPLISILQRDRADVVLRLRQEFVDQLWIGLAGLAMLLLPLSLARMLETGWLQIYNFHVVISLFVVGFAYFRERLSLNIKASLFIGITWSLALMGVLNFGMAAPALWWLVASLVAVVVVYGSLIGMVAVTIILVTLVVVAAGFVLGLIKMTTNLNQAHSSATFWLNYFVSIISFLFVVIQSLKVFHESAVSESLYRFQQWIDDLGLGVMVLDNKQQILYWNIRAKSLLEGQLVDNPELNFSERFGFRVASKGIGYPNEKLPITRAYLGESSVVDDVETAGVIPYKLQIWARPTYTPSGAFEGVVVTLDEITQRKLHERMKSEFVGMVSHELRTPVTSIRGALGILNSNLASELSEKARSLVGIAHSNTERLLNIVNDILDMQKIEAGRMDFQFGMICLNQLVQKTVADMEAYGEQFKVKLGYKNPPQKFWSNADKDRIQQVLTNLISNAIKFSPEGSEVVVDLTVEDGRIKVAVTDRGPGIPEDFKSRIFQPFSQLDTSSTRAKSGTGLGLAISKVIVEQHLGQIGFSSQVGQGSTFYFYLPVANV